MAREDKSTPKGANKYSVYAQRDVESTQVNYADAAATLTKSFTDVRDDRKERKEDLEDSFDETMSVLDQVEDMQTPTAGEKITQASQMSVDSLVDMNTKMQNGEITVREYQRYEDRLKSGYANVSKVVKNWDTWQGETNTRMTEGISGYLEIGNAQDVQPLGQFADHELVTNPATGNLAYAVLTPDGKLPTDPAAFIPPSQVYSSMKYRQNKYNVGKAVEGTLGSVATIITAAQAEFDEDGVGGGITSFEDFRQLGDIGGSGLKYEGWMDSQIAAIVNETTAGQILVDRAGYGAAPTLEEFNKRFPGLPEDKWIPYTTKDGVITPMYKEGQIKEAQNVVRDMIESGIDSKTTMTAGKGPTAETSTQAALRLQNEAKLVDLQIVNDIAAGDLGAYLSSGSQGIIGVNQRLQKAGIKSEDSLIDSITRQGDEIIVEYQSGRIGTPIKRKNKDGSFRTTEEIGKEVYQLISADGKSFVNDLKTARKDGFKFDLNVRNKTEAEVESMLEINKATEYLISEGITNPTPAQITQAIEDQEIDSITEAELKEAMESGTIPQVYTGEDAVQYASRQALTTRNVGDNITKSVGAKLNDTTGADYIKQKYNEATGQDKENLKTLATYNPLKDGSEVRARALQGPMQATLIGYLPRKLKGKVDMTLKDDGTIEVKYGGKTLDITGVTNITLGTEETFEKLDAITNQIAQDVTARYNTVLQSREGGAPTAKEVADATDPEPDVNPGDALFNQVTTANPQTSSATEEAVVTEEAIVPEEAVTEEAVAVEEVTEGGVTEEAVAVEEVTEEVVPEVTNQAEMAINNPIALNELGERGPIPLTVPANASIPALENYEGIIKGSPTADLFVELIEDKTYYLGGKGTGNWTVRDGKDVQTDVETIDCSGAVCTIRNAQGKDYDLNNTNAKKFLELAEERNIPIESAKDGNLILMNVDGNGIDHIGFVIVDENGNKFIAESSSSYGGTTITKFDERIADLKKRKKKFSYEIVSDTKQPPPEPTLATTDPSGNSIDPNFTPPTGGTGPSQQAASDPVPTENRRETFYTFQGEMMETDHGNTPVETNDSSEEGKTDKSLDIGYGHKIQQKELDSGEIYGIKFIDDEGKYIPITQEQKEFIQQKDNEVSVNIARKEGWDEKLKKQGLSWDGIEEKYKLALEDLAYNVGGAKAADEWTAIFKDIKNNDLKSFVGNLRRKDNSKYTAGMDNRAAKAAYAAGLIKNLKEAKEYGLILANTTDIPA